MMAERAVNEIVRWFKSAALKGCIGRRIQWAQVQSGLWEGLPAERADRQTQPLANLTRTRSHPVAATICFGKEEAK